MRVPCDGSDLNSWNVIISDPVRKSGSESFWRKSIIPDESSDIVIVSFSASGASLIHRTERVTGEVLEVDPDPSVTLYSN